MLSDWELVEKYEKNGKPYEHVIIELYRRDGKDWSFGVKIGVYGLGMATPCMELHYIYQTKQAALQGAVDYITDKLNSDPNYADYKKALMDLLPSTEPDLFS